MTASRTRRLAGALSGPGSKLSLAAAASLTTVGFGTIGRYALQVVLAQLLGTAGFGLYLTMRRWGELVGLLPNRGYQGAVVRFLPEYEVEQRWEPYRGLRRQSFRNTSVVAVGLAAVALAIGLVAWPDHRLAAALAMATIPAWAGFRMVQAVLQAQHQFVPSSAVDQLFQPAVMAALLGLIWLGGWTIGLDLVMATLLVSVLAAALAVTFLAYRGAPAQVRSEVGIDHSEAGRWQALSRQFFTFQLASAAINSADLLILAMFVPPAEVGLYGVASRLALLARAVNNGAESIVAPRIASAWTSGDLAGLQRHVDKALAVAIPPTTLLVVLLTIFRGPVLGIMGTEFRAASELTVILLIGTAVQGLTGPCGHVVALTNNERFHARTMAGAAIFLVIACFIAAPLGGPVLVAVVTTATNTGWNLVLVGFARRRLGIRCYPRPQTLAALRSVRPFR